MKHKITNKYVIVGNEPFGLLTCILETNAEVHQFGTEEEYRAYCQEKGIYLPEPETPIEP